MRTLIAQDYNPVSGITTRYFSSINEKTGKPCVVVQVLQDVEPHLDQNKAELNARSAKARVTAKDGYGLGTKVASIPMGLVEQLASQGLNVITCSPKDLKKLLNSPEYSKLRTAYGRV